MHCGLVRCPGAKSTRFSIIPVVSFSRVHAISSRLQCNTADLPPSRWVPTLPSQYPGYQRKQSTWPWTLNNSCILFFGLGDDIDFHCIDCCLVSESYVNTQVSSQVIIKFNTSGSFSVRCKRSKHNSLWCSFCSSDSSFGTIFAQTFLMFHSYLRIHRTLFLSKLTSSATARIPNLRSFRITSCTFSMLSSVTAVRGWPGQSSSFKLSLPSENRLCHSNMHARDMQSSP